MDADGFRDWLRRYFEAWVSNDPTEVAGLFTEDATYHVDPFEDEPRMRGREEIVRLWTAESHHDVRYAYEPAALEGDVGVAHWRVSFGRRGKPGREELDGILVLAFAPDGRCREHREWFVRRDVPDA